MCKTHTDSRIFLIADTHFGDDNIRLYEERPFPDTDTMDLEMIRRWNSVVGDHDLVYHLGDFCSGGQERCRELLSRLKGRKFLVMGNHDSYLSPQQWRDLGFEECYDLPVILKDFFILSHTPLYVTRNIGPSAAAAPASVWSAFTTRRSFLKHCGIRCLKRNNRYFRYKLLLFARF